MSLKRKAIVHIGAPKTGTAAIQTFCYEYRKYFAERYGIYYPDHEQLVRPESGYGHHYLAFHVFRPFFSKITPPHIDLDNTFNLFREILKDSSYPHLLISCEALLSLPLTDKFSEFTEILREFYDELYIIIYVRRQDEAILAAYNTHILMGFYIDINDFIQSKYISFDYYRVIKLYDDFGFLIKARPYEKKFFKEGDLILDFLGVLDEIVKTKIELPEDYQRDKYILNITQPHFIVKLIANFLKNNQANAKKTTDSLKKLGKILLTELPELNQKKWDLIPPSKRREILDYFEESNIRLSKEYLNIEGLWYDMNLPGDDSIWREENSFSGSALYHLCNVVIKILEKKK